MNISTKPAVEAHGNFVDGREIEAGSSEMLDVRNPATGLDLAAVDEIAVGSDGWFCGNIQASLPSIMIRLNRIMISSLSLSMICSENRFPLFRIML